MLEWLGRQSISVAERSAAYGLLPDVDIDDSSLEGTCGALVEAACSDTLNEQHVLLTDAGELREAHDAVMVPSVLSDIWPNADLSELFDGEARPIFARHVTEENAQKLVNWTFSIRSKRPMSLPYCVSSIFPGRKHGAGC
jgi:hypothetical protein